MGVDIFSKLINLYFETIFSSFSGAICYAKFLNMFLFENITIFEKIISKKNGGVINSLAGNSFFIKNWNLINSFNRI